MSANAQTTNNNGKPGENAKVNKIIIGIAAVAVVAVIAVFGIVYQRGKTTQDNVVKIGVNLSLTGPMAYWSTQIKNGLDLAVEQISYNGKKVKLVYEDNGGQAKNGVTAFQKLNMEKVCAVITAHTSIAQPQQVPAAQLKIPLLGTIIGPTDFGKKNEWSFLDWPAHEDVTPPLVEYVTQNLEAKTAAILVVNDDYGKDGAVLFTELFTKTGGKILIEETVQNDDIDVRVVLTKIITQNPDVLYTVTRENTLLAVIKQCAELGYKGRIIGEHSMASSNIMSNLPENIELVFGGSKGIADIDKMAPDFVEAYKKRFNETPDWVTLYGYSLGEYLFPIALKANGDNDKIRQMLSSLDITGVRGKLVMSDDRKISTRGSVYSLKNKQCNVVFE